MVADFTLDTSTLGGGGFTTVPVPTHGEFAGVQFRFTQGGVAQDLEFHFMELHFTVTGVIEHAV